MTGSDEHVPSVPLRASDAERDRVEALLRHHFAVGRLTLAELEERAAAAYEARTREQLDALVRDLPGAAEQTGPQADVLDSRLLIVLLCCAPPAALVYWLVSRRAARRNRADPAVLRPRACGEPGGAGGPGGR